MFYFPHSSYYYYFLVYALFYCYSLPLKCKNLVFLIQCCIPHTYNSAWHIADTQYLTGEGNDDSGWNVQCHLMQGPLLYLSVNDHKLGVFCGPWRRASVYRPRCSLARGPAFGLTFEKKNYRACAENCICHYQLVFEIVRRAIELSRFRYSYGFLTHFSQWWPILNDCSFSHFSLKYCSQLVACPGLQEFESGSGKGWRAPTDTMQEG